MLLLACTSVQNCSKGYTCSTQSYNDLLPWRQLVFDPSVNIEYQTFYLKDKFIGRPVLCVENYSLRLLKIRKKEEKFE